MKGELTRNANTWTESQYWAGVRKALRRLFRFNWLPAKYALEAARRPYVGPNKQQKWEFKCAECEKYFIRKLVELDHIIPCGSLKGLEDRGGFRSVLHPSRQTSMRFARNAMGVKTAEERKIERQTQKGP